MSRVRTWTKKNLAILRREYPVKDTYEVAKKIGTSRRACMIKACELKIKKTRAAKRTWTAHTKLPKDWGFGKDPSRFTRGRPSPFRMPLGAEFTSKKEDKTEVFVKVSMTGKKSRDWRLKSRVVWEQHNGRKLESDEVVSFADGNPLNFDPGNLVVKTKRQIMEENSIHNLPPEIAQIHRAIGQVTRIVRRRSKEQ